MRDKLAGVERVVRRAISYLPRYRTCHGYRDGRSQLSSIVAGFVARRSSGAPSRLVLSRARVRKKLITLIREQDGEAL